MPGHAAELPGSADKVVLEAEQMSGDARRGQAAGNVKACFQDFTLYAPVVEFDRDNDLLSAPSSFQLKTAADTISGGSLHYQPQAQRGEATEITATVQGLQLSADALYLSPSGYRAATVAITSCPDEGRDWWLEAKEISSDRKTWRGEDLIFRVGDGVPIMYWPHLLLPHTDEKYSGFLHPTIDYDSESGLRFGIPYYWFLADPYDATTTPTWTSSHGILLKNEFRYLTPQTDGDAILDWTPFADEDRGRQYWRHTWQRGRWELNLAADNVSDPHYFTDFSENTRLLATRNLSRRASWEYDGDQWQIGVAAESFKTLQLANNITLSPPFDIFPHAYIRRHGKTGALHWSSAWETARFVRNDPRQPEATRWLWRAQARRHWDFGGIEITPEAGFHAAAYQALSDGDNVKFIVPHLRTQAESGFRRAPLGNDASYQWRLAFAYAPAQTAQNKAPLFDTTLRRFSAGGAFDWNRFSGGDRAADAHLLAYGVNLHWWDAAARRERASLELAQRYYLRRPRIVLGDDFLGREQESEPPNKGFANAVASFQARWDSRWRLEADAEWNPTSDNFESVYTDVRADFGDRRLLRAGFLLDEEESAVLGASLPLHQRVDVAFLLRYLLNKNSIAESAAAIEWRDECACWKTFIKISNFSIGEDSNVAYSVGIEFLGLGSIGSSGYDDIISDLRL